MHELDEGAIGTVLVEIPELEFSVNGDI